MKKYKIIYADPPWLYGSQGPRGGKFAALDYSSMTVADMCKMNIPAITDNDCALFMWFTGSFMSECLAVGKAWGFKFIRIDKVWIKKTSNNKAHAACGPWGMSDCEFIGLFTKGKMCSTQIQRNQYVSQEAKYTGTHSEKPLVFRDMIQNRFPSNFPRLEMFARYSAPEWDVFGNEAPNSIWIPNKNTTLNSIFRRS